MKKRKSKRKFKSSTRNYDAKYKEWIFAVFKRDNFKCVLCGSKKQIQAHHIIRYADSHSGRYAVGNGATTCNKCHKKITGHEHLYVPVLRAKIKKNE